MLAIDKGYTSVVDSISYENMLLINSDGDGKLEF